MKCAGRLLAGGGLPDYFVLQLFFVSYIMSLSQSFFFLHPFGLLSFPIFTFDLVFKLYLVHSHSQFTFSTQHSLVEAAKHLFSEGAGREVRGFLAK